VLLLVHPEPEPRGRRGVVFAGDDREYLLDLRSEFGDAVQGGSVFPLLRSERVHLGGQ
jgi:hypothetical protein